MNAPARDRQVQIDPPARAGAARAANEAAPGRRLSARTRGLLIGVGIGVLVISGIWGVHWWLVGRFIEGTDDAYLQADSVTVAPKVSGYIVEVYVADNQFVAAGAPLARLDSRHYQAALDELEERALHPQRALAHVSAPSARRSETPRGGRPQSMRAWSSGVLSSA